MSFPGGHHFTVLSQFLTGAVRHLWDITGRGLFTPEPFPFADFALQPLSDIDPSSMCDQERGLSVPLSDS
jgi:hypothetical protein